MSRKIVFVLFFLGVFLQAGAYGLTFMLPKLFGIFGADEKDVGMMLMITAIVTIITVYFSGHLSDLFGRLTTLSIACFSISLSLFLYGYASTVGITLILASILLGFGWGLTYTLCPIVLTRLINDHERVRFFALLSVFVMAGFGFSPVMASAMEDNGLSISDSFYLTSAFCFISAVIFIILVKPVKLHAIDKEYGALSRLNLSSIKSILKSKALFPVLMGCLGGSVFAGMNNFQTVFADAKGLEYSWFFFTYTVTVVVFRIVLVKFKGGSNPYRTIALLQSVMFISILVFYFMPNNEYLYLLVAFLFGIGYGVSYPILVAMAANDSNKNLLPQTLQLFSLTYFIGIFAFPLLAGWLIVEVGAPTLLILISFLALIETSMAFKRSLEV